MNKIYLFAILLSLVVALSSCNKNTKQTPDELSGSLLWEVSGNGLPQSSYILGSYHVETKDFVEENVRGIKEAFAASNNVVGEVDMADMMSQIPAMQAAMAMPADTTYQMLLSLEDYNFLDEKFKGSFGAGLDQMGQLKPSAISMIYFLMQYSKLTGKNLSDPNAGMDIYFQNEGKKLNKKVMGLETAQEQIDLLYGFEPLQKQALDLVCGMKNEEYTVGAIQKLDSIYRTQNLTAMNELSNDTINDPCFTGNEFMSKLTTDRNNNWMKQLPQLLQDDSNFIVVGALHLCGEDGILQQLVDKGYTVTPVK